MNSYFFKILAFSKMKVNYNLKFEISIKNISILFIIILNKKNIYIIKNMKISWNIFNIFYSFIMVRLIIFKICLYFLSKFSPFTL